MQQDKVFMPMINDDSSNHELQQFIKETNSRNQVNSIRLLRIGVLLAFILHSIYALTDHIFIPDNLDFVRITRLALLMPSILIIYPLSFHKSFPDNLNYFAAIPALTNAIGFSLWAYTGGQEGVEYCYTAIIMVVAFSYFLLGIPFKVASLYGWFAVLLFFSVLIIMYAQDRVEYETALLAGMHVFATSFLITLGAYRSENLMKLVFRKSVQLKQEESKRLEWLEIIARFLRHELKTPIHGITMSVEMIDRKVQHETLPKYTDRIKTSISKMTHLLDGASEATSIEANFLEKEKTRINLCSLLHERSEYYDEIYASTDIKIENKSSDLSIMGHQESIEQMLDKLISNAVDFSREGTTILIRVFEANDHFVALSIKNEGEPLPEDNTNLFEFQVSYRKPEKGTHENVGFGLFIVKLIAEQHGGIVEAVNREGVSGAIFNIYLPRVT